MDDETRAKAFLIVAAQNLGYKSIEDMERNASEEQLLEVIATAISMSDLDASSASRAFMRLLYMGYEIRPTREGLMDLINIAVPERSHNKYFRIVEGATGQTVISATPLFLAINGIFGAVFHGFMTLDEAMDIFADDLRPAAGRATARLRSAGGALSKISTKLQKELRKIFPGTDITDEDIKSVSDEYKRVRDSFTDAAQRVTELYQGLKQGDISKEVYSEEIKRTLAEHGITTKSYYWPDDVVDVDSIYAEVQPYEITDGKRTATVVAHHVFVIRIPMTERGMIGTRSSSKIADAIDSILRARREDKTYMDMDHGSVEIRRL